MSDNAIPEWCPTGSLQFSMENKTLGAVSTWLLAERTWQRDELADGLLDVHDHFQLISGGKPVCSYIVELLGKALGKLADREDG